MNRVTQWTLIFLAILAIGSSPGMSQTATDTAPAQGAPRLDLSALQQLRDPFWPIGWTPPPVEANVVSRPATQLSGPVRWDDAVKLLEPTALTQLPTGHYIAVLKGIGVVEVGDIVAVKHGGLIYRWEIKSITSEGIAPQQLGVSAPRGN